MPPAPLLGHQSISTILLRVLFPIIKTGELHHAPTDVKLGENGLQPDIFWVAPDNDQCIPVDGKYWQGAPDFVIEILSPSTAKRDRGTKFDIYEKHGVREYWLVEPNGQYLEVYVLTDGAFVRQGVYDAADTFTSPVLQHEIDVAVIFGKPKTDD